MKRELPGHIRKAFLSVERFLPVVDLIVEMVDARMPEGSRMRGFVERLQKASVIALGKGDLADPEQTDGWVKYYAEQGVRAIPLDARDRNSVKRLARFIRDYAFEQEGPDSRPKRKVRRIMVIGIPNVGKSTLINALAGRKAAQTANKPGVTRNVQWIKLAGQLELLDLPGILDFSLLRRGEILKLINTMPGRDEDPYALAKLLVEVLQIAGCYHVLPEFADKEQSFDTYLSSYAMSRNFLVREGAPDLHRGANDLIRRFQNGGFGRITLETQDAHLEDLLATED